MVYTYADGRTVVLLYGVEFFVVFVFCPKRIFIDNVYPPRNCSDFLKKCIKRVLRLAIPIMGAAVFTFVIQWTIGFYNFKIQDTISNTWITHLYGTPLILRNIIEEPFRVLLLGSSKYNSPFWCLRDMLFVSPLIYAVSWICKTTRVKGFVLGVFILFAVVANKGVVVACLVGSLTVF